VARTILVDDSYFRQIGVTRALQIAGEHGWRLPEDSVRCAPKWLVLHRSTDLYEDPHRHAQLTQPHWLAPSWQQPTGSAP
jgi:hypothetical protein